MRTFLGSVAADLSEPKGATDFDSGIKAFVSLMVRFMLVMVSVTFLIVGITKRDWLEALLFGLSVAVGLTPEMLPMIVTVCLSKGAVFMSRKKVIVKKLKAIQNLGAMDILCTDKTGTITQDKVVLERHVDVTNRPSEDVLRYAWMNSYYQTGLRNLLDHSILSNEDLDVERTCRKVDEIPFDFVRKRMSVIIEYEGDHVLICKGSVEAIFEACDRYQIDEDVLPLIDVLRQDILEEYESLSSAGLPRAGDRLPRVPARQGELLRRRRDRPDPPRLPRLLRPAQGLGREGHQRPPRARRAGQGPHRRQRAGHQEDLRRRRASPRTGSSPARSWTAWTRAPSPRP